MVGVFKATYLKKQGTLGSYYASYLKDFMYWASRKDWQTSVAKAYYQRRWQGIRDILPYHLQMVKPSQSGHGHILRNREIVCSLKAKFAKIEDSPYKKFPPYNVQTAVWKCEGEQNIYYGEPAISQPNGRMGKSIVGDTLIVYTEDWQELQVFVFHNPMMVPFYFNLPEAVAQVKYMMENQKKRMAKPSPDVCSNDL